jgi:hypothetical protein
MIDANNMSMEDLVRFAEQGILPDGEFDAPEDDSAGEELDMNDLSVEDLLAMAEGKPVAPKAGESTAAAVSEEASEDDLRALLSDTLSDDELGGGDDYLAIAKNIQKLKLRQLCNRIEEMAPPKMFNPRKDEIYYFLSSVAGQSAKVRMEDAEAKCAFIGKAIVKLESYMISDAGFSMDEQEALAKLFATFSNETVNETNDRNRVFEYFRFGWRQSIKRLSKDIQSLKRFAPESQKPIWILFTFYESLSRAYGLCRAQESLKQYQEELNTEMTKEDKRAIVNAFEEVVELAPYYGLKSIDFINRKQAYDAVEKLDLPAIIAILKEKRKKA